jgi:hypothetical protein
MSKTRFECLQCGALVETIPGDPVYQCEFCKTKSYLASHGVLRYIHMPQDVSHNAFQTDFNIAGAIVQIPFWSIKGLQYRVMPDKKIEFSLINSTIPALNQIQFTHNLGYLPDVLDLKLDLNGDLVPAPQINIKTAFELTEKRLQTLSFRSKSLFDRLIGETYSLISVPFRIMKNNEGFNIKNIFNEQIIETLDENSAQMLLKHTREFFSQYKTTPLPLRCPNCASDLPVEHLAVSVICSHCFNLWRLNSAGYEWQKYLTALPKHDNHNFYLPFWDIEIHLGGFNINSKYDLMTAAMPYRLWNEEWKNLPLKITAPAFKLNPTLFLKLSHRFSLLHTEHDIINERLPFHSQAHSIILSEDEAIQSLKVIFANMFINKKSYFEGISDLRINIGKIDIIYYPFRKSHHELINDELNISVPLNAIKLGTVM